MITLSAPRENSLAACVNVLILHETARGIDIEAEIMSTVL